MIRWLWKIIVGAKPAASCTRECLWEAHEGHDSNLDGKRIGVIYVLRCKTCGDMKNHVVGRL